LDGSFTDATSETVLERSGWARSVAGVNPYLTLFARAGVSRERADADVAALHIHELPAARGCTYVIPAADFALALRCGREAAHVPLKIAAKLGVTPGEIDTLCEAVASALKKGPLDPDGIREATGSASRSLGAEGVKKGMSTTLPLALGLLQSTGVIRRVPVNGRLDQQRYTYTIWDLKPAKLDDGEVFIELARRYFRWIGPATMAEFQWFSGLGVKAAKAAVEPLSLQALESDRLMFPDDLDSLRSFKPPKKPVVHLIASIDSLIHHRRDHKSLLDSADAAFAGDKGPVQSATIADLPNHAIVDRGRIVGAWEYDPSAERIVYATFGQKTKEIAAAVAHTAAFIRDQLGDARSFSLDSPKSREPRLKQLRGER
jgi:hypothetical protein